MIKTIKLNTNKNQNEIFHTKNAESKKAIVANKAASLIKNKNCNFNTSFQHIDDTVVENDDIVSRDEIHSNTNNCCRGNFDDKMGNEENHENVENSYVYLGFLLYYF